MKRQVKAEGGSVVHEQEGFNPMDVKHISTFAWHMNDNVAVRVLVLGGSESSASSHLKPGSSQSPWKLVEDVLWVCCPYTPLTALPASLQTITGHLALAPGHQAEHLTSNVNGRGRLLHLVHDALQHTNSSLTTALEDYASLAQPSHSKRGLNDGLSQLPQMLFG